MSKFAIEAYSTALRQELSQLGMPVIVINPGAMRTPLLTDQLEGGKNAFLEKPPKNSLFGASMLKGANIAQDYMKRNAQGQ
jgi:short-subunit dehydrogenase